MPPKSIKKRKTQTSAAELIHPDAQKVKLDPLARTQSGEKYNIDEHGNPHPNKKLIRRTTFGRSSQDHPHYDDHFVEENRRTWSDYLTNTISFVEGSSPRTSANTESNKRKREGLGLKRKTRKSKHINHKKTKTNTKSKHSRRLKHTQKKH